MNKKKSVPFNRQRNLCVNHMDMEVTLEVDCFASKWQHLGRVNIDSRHSHHFSSLEKSSRKIKDGKIDVTFQS